MTDFPNRESKYTADNIELLPEMEGIRKRPGMYIGATGSGGLHHLIWEIVDNGVDEAANGYGSKITVTLHKDGSCSVEDDGRGIPVDIHKATGLPAIQIIYTKLHSGGKFSDKAYQTSAGLHGVGATVVNALSTYVDVTVFRDGQIHHIRFENGGHLAVPLESLGPTRKRGTLVRFLPDPTIFSTTDFKWDTVASHLQEEAFLLRNVTFVLIDERIKKTEEFHYETGLAEYVNILNQNRKPIGEIVHFTDETGAVKMEVAMQWSSDAYDERVLSYANAVRTGDGGTHETGLRTGMTKAVNDWAIQNEVIRENQKLDGNDIREGLTCVVSVKVPEKLALYESQTKQKLTSPDILPLITEFVYSNLLHYMSEHKEFAVDLVRKCQAAKQARDAARKAKEAARSGKQKKTESAILSDKLAAAQSKDYKNNELFIVEGDSAGGSAKSGRDRLHQAILPLRGKPLNTDSVSMERMLSNTEFSTIIQTIGAGVGPDFDVEESHYGKIIIMTDADTDGAHIQILLLTFFYNYMKPLITHGMVYIACPPLYRIYKKSDPAHKFIYAWDDASLEEAKKKIGPGYGINRYKGLGEMNADQLAVTTMNKATRQLLQVKIDDPLVVEKRISVLMGNDASLRREWIEQNIKFNELDRFIKEVSKNG